MPYFDSAPSRSISFYEERERERFVWRTFSSSRGKAVSAEEKDGERRREVDKDVLEMEQCGERRRARVQPVLKKRKEKTPSSVLPSQCLF